MIESRVDIVKNGSQFGLDNASDFGRVGCWPKIHLLKSRRNIVVSGSTGTDKGS
jgi:hypothetical protein